MDMTEILKQCPFCGSGIIGRDKGDEDPVYWMQCEECCATGPLACQDEWGYSEDEEGHAEEAAIERWNRRAAPEWSTDPPTEPGWYWHAIDEDGPVFPVNCDFVGKEFRIGGFVSIAADGKKVLYGTTVERHLKAHPNAKWLKIEGPENPK